MSHATCAFLCPLQGLLTALLLYTDHSAAALKEKNPSAILPTGVICGTHCDIGTLKSLEQTARCVANLAIAGTELAAAGVLRTSKGTYADPLAPWRILLEQWGSSCDIGLRTQAGRALCNLAARSGSVPDAPIYDDMLWPLIGIPPATHAGHVLATDPASDSEAEAGRTPASGAVTSLDATVAVGAPGSPSGAPAAAVGVPAEATEAVVLPQQAPQDIDIVLVHGLRGGPLVTWRSGHSDDGAPTVGTSDLLQRKVARTRGTVLAEAASCISDHQPWGTTADYDSVLSTPLYRSIVWPVAWLAQDLVDRGFRPRVVSVEYNGHIVIGESPHIPKSLDELAVELVSQLHDARACLALLCVHPPPLSCSMSVARVCLAGIGVNRPVVFLTHSMGGLLTKKVRHTRWPHCPPCGLRSIFPLTCLWRRSWWRPTAQVFPQSGT